MGMHIARLTVAGILLPKMFERFPNMRLEDTPAVNWRGFGFRGPINLPIRLD
jgi:cytochrome P450